MLCGCAGKARITWRGRARRQTEAELIKTKSVWRFPISHPSFIPSTHNALEPWTSPSFLILDSTTNLPYPSHWSGANLLGRLISYWNHSNMMRSRISSLSVILFLQFLFMGTAFLTPPTCAIRSPQTWLFSSSPEVTPEMEKNSIFIKGLMENLEGLCDKYILSGSEKVVR